MTMSTTEQDRIAMRFMDGDPVEMSETERAVHAHISGLYDQLAKMAAENETLRKARAMAEFRAAQEGAIRRVAVDAAKTLAAGLEAEQLAHSPAFKAGRRWWNR